MKAGYSPSTVHKAAQLVSGVLRSAVRARRLAVNPASDVALPTIERPERSFLTAEQIIDLADGVDPRYRGMILLGGFAGLRLGEVCALLGSSVGVGLRSVTVTDTVTDVGGEISIGPPKTRASIRTVALPAFLADELSLIGNKDELVFTAPESGPIRPGHWRRRFWAPAVKAAGLEGVTFHGLRHSQGALLVEQGRASPGGGQEARSQLRQSTPTGTYSRVSINRRRTSLTSRGVQGSRAAQGNRTQS